MSHSFPLPLHSSFQEAGGARKVPMLMNPNEHGYRQKGPKSWGTGVVGTTAGSCERLWAQSWLRAPESRRPGTHRPVYTESRNNTSLAGTGPCESSLATDCSLMTNFHLQGSPGFSFHQLANLGREVSEQNQNPPGLALSTRAG